MAVLSDDLIRQLCMNKIGDRYQAELLEPINGEISRTIATIDGHVNGGPMIEEYVDRQVRSEGGDPVVSYGLTSAGYDVRLGRDFKVFTDVFGAVIDPLKPRDDYYTELLDRDYIIVPARSYVLGHTVETFNMPRDLVAECLGKSTWARCGLNVNVTPIEPEFVGQVVIEIANSTPNPVKLYSGMGIAQFFFHTILGRVEVSYADRGGKYQGQQGVTTALV